MGILEFYGKKSEFYMLLFILFKIMSKSLGKTGVLVKRVILMLRGLNFITKIAMSVGVMKVPVICDGFLTVLTWEVPRILYARSLVFLNYGN